MRHSPQGHGSSGPVGSHLCIWHVICYFYGMTATTTTYEPMNDLINEIKTSRTHQVVLGVVLVLTLLSGVWKFSGSSAEHVTDRQQAIEEAVKGF